MSRSVPWRRVCPDVVKRRIEEALDARFYILRETGPTGFLVKQDESDKKFKVFLGDQNSCTCQCFLKERDSCIHILWVLLRKFRIGKENPLVFQKALVEREINEIIQGVHVQRNVNVKAAGGNNAGKNEMAAKSIDEEDVCPICQEEFLGCKEPLTHCRYGCGNNIHIKCMKVWAQHRKSDGDSMIKCPLCRSDFGTFQEIIQEFHKLSSKQRRRIETADVHIGATCQHCKLSPIQGKCYRCVVCLDFHLCQECFGKDIHVKHSFQFRKNTNQRWRPAPRNQNANMVIGIAENSQDGRRQISQVADSSGRIPSEKLHEDSDEIKRHFQCQICCASFQESDTVRRLACKHTFHKFCIDDWMSRGSNVCPLDGQKLAGRSNRMLQERDTSTNMKGSATMQENAGLTILGINSVHGMVIKPPCAPTQSRRRIRHSVSSVAGNTADLNDLIVNGSSRRSTLHELDDSLLPFQTQSIEKKTPLNHTRAGNRSAPNVSSKMNTLPPIHPTASQPRSQSGDQLNRRHRPLAIVSPSISSEHRRSGTHELSVGPGGAIMNGSDLATRSMQNTKCGQLVKKRLSGLTASSISTSEPNLSSLIDVFQVSGVTRLRDLDQSGT